MKVLVEERKMLMEQVIRAALAEAGFPNPVMEWDDDEGWGVEMEGRGKPSTQQVWRAHFLACQALGDMTGMSCWPCYERAIGDECEHEPVWA